MNELDELGARPRHLRQQWRIWWIGIALLAFPIAADRVNGGSALPLGTMVIGSAVIHFAWLPAVALLAALVCPLAELVATSLAPRFQTADPFAVRAARGLIALLVPIALLPLSAGTALFALPAGPMEVTSPSAGSGTRILTYEEHLFMGDILDHRFCVPEGSVVPRGCSGLR